MIKTKLFQIQLYTGVSQVIIKKDIQKIAS